MEEYDEFFLTPNESNVDAISLKINGDILSSLSNDKKITFTMNGNVMILHVGDVSYEFKTEKLSTPSYIYQRNYEEDSLQQVGLIKKKFVSINFNPSEEYISQQKQINDMMEITKKSKGINQPKKKEPLPKKFELTKAKKPINTIPPKSTIQTKTYPPKPKINESKPLETRAPINQEIKSKTVEPLLKDEEEDDFLQLGEIKKEPIPINTHNNPYHPNNSTKTSPNTTNTSNSSTNTSPTNTLPNPHSSNHGTLNKKVENFVSKNKFLNNTNNTTTTPHKDQKELSESSSHSHDSHQKDKSNKSTSLNNPISTNKSNHTKKQEVNTPLQPKTSISSNQSNTIFSATNDENHNDVNLSSNKKQEIPQKNKNGNHLPPSSSTHKKYERPIENHKIKPPHSLVSNSNEEIVFNRNEISKKMQEYEKLFSEGRELHKELTENSEFFLRLKRKFKENPESKQDNYNDIKNQHESRRGNIQKKLKIYNETCKKIKEIDDYLFMIHKKFPNDLERIA